MLARTPKRAPRARASKKGPPVEFLLAPAEPPAQFGRLLESLTSGQRKQYPMTTGLGDYFPDALAEVSHVSWAGNEKHNPGEPLHWARGKSMDHADCAARHLQARGTVEDMVVNGQTIRVRHSAQLAWRALAILQEELEAEFNFHLPLGATTPAKF